MEPCLRRPSTVSTALCAFLLLLPLGTLAQQPTGKRPKIGLALEGGSALGFAHIGVLQWFEEHRIPIDYIAGTSMGGLVGGLYSTGMSPAELREVISTIDWSQTLRGAAPLSGSVVSTKAGRTGVPERARIWPSTRILAPRPELVRYLLGELSEDEQAQVEDRAFADKGYLGELEAA